MMLDVILTLNSHNLNFRTLKTNKCFKIYNIILKEAPHMIIYFILVSLLSEIFGLKSQQHLKNIYLFHVILIFM